MAMMTPNQSDPRALPKVRGKGNQANAKAQFVAAEKNEAAREANADVKHSTSPLAQCLKIFQFTHLCKFVVEYVRNCSKLNGTRRLLRQVFLDAPNNRLTRFFFDWFAIEYKRHFLPTPLT